jgi:hypothetical protein
MTISDNTLSSPDDIDLGFLLGALDANPDAPLVFSYDGNDIRGGYHITEVKAGHFSALDCGANPEAWSEIFVQLWDVDEDARTHMAAGKFASVVRKVSEHVALDGSAKLTFELSDGVAPMQLHKASSPVLRDGVLRVDLGPRPASCKPRDRWLAGTIERASACCGPLTSGAQCCA